MKKTDYFTLILFTAVIFAGFMIKGFWGGLLAGFFISLTIFISVGKVAALRQREKLNAVFDSLVEMAQNNMPEPEKTEDHEIFQPKNQIP